MQAVNLRSGVEGGDWDAPVFVQNLFDTFGRVGAQATGAFSVLQTLSIAPGKTRVERSRNF